jgi:hypothetical protein
MRKQYIASYIMFAKRLKWVYEDGAEGVDKYYDEDHTGGGWSQPETILAVFPPSDLHRRRPSDSLFMCFYLRHRSIDETVGNRIYRSF